MLRVLEKFNFGESFIKWVKTIYSEAESCVTNNGWMSKPFYIEKGIRQGCPLSALLFLLVAEVLAEKIRTKRENGMKIQSNDKTKYIQISQLADDTTLFLQDENAIIECLNIVEQFGTVSGLKLNKEKTEGLWLGRGQNRIDTFAGINWGQNYVKALGVYFGYNKKEIENKNWKDKLEALKKSLTYWNLRDLTFQGRILIIKSIALSKLVYLVSSICIPTWVINEVNKEFFGFIWKYKRDKISRKVMINDLEAGGMNMIDFKSFCTAMKAIWAERLYKSQDETWSIIPNKYLEKCSIVRLMCMNHNKSKLIPVKLPQFYEEMISGWHLCGGGQKAPQSDLDVRQEFIWGNKYIQHKGKTLYFYHWSNSNINFIDDLLNKEGKFKTGAEICLHLKQKTNWIAEYSKLLKSIPVSWKDKLKNTKMDIKVKKELKPFIWQNDKTIFDLPSKSKEYYQILIGKIKKRSHNEKYWSSLFPDRPLWTEVWCNKVKNPNIKKLGEFNFKLLHRILPSQENLYKWKISNSNNCRFGCSCLESYHHMFVACSRLTNVLTKLENKLQSQSINLQFSYKILIFGYKLVFPAYRYINIFLSHVFFAIYKYWIHNDHKKDIDSWMYSELKLWQIIYKENKELDILKIFDKILEKW